jgi:enoyl-CoA hydratase/carnithine racemase
MAEVNADGFVRCERRGPIAWIVLDRPAARNAISFAMWDRLGAIARDLSADGALRAAVIAGGPDAFAAGADIAEFTKFTSLADGYAYEARVEGVLRAIESLPFPTIAAIAGACTGGGVFLACACDLRIGAEGLRAGVPIARTLGNTATLGNARRLAAVLGPARLKQWILTARLFDAREAEAAGLVSEVLPGYEPLLTRAQQLADEIASFAPLTLRAAKATYRSLIEGDEEPARRAFDACYASDDFREGVAAFFAKRRPEWHGR